MKAKIDTTTEHEYTDAAEWQATLTVTGSKRDPNFVDDVEAWHFFGDTEEDAVEAARSYARDFYGLIV